MKIYDEKKQISEQVLRMVDNKPNIGFNIVARTHVKSDDDRDLTIFITRNSDFVKIESEYQIASYYSPMGSLASSSVGTEKNIYLPKGSISVEVVNRTVFENYSLLYRDMGATFFLQKEYVSKENSLRNYLIAEPKESELKDITDKASIEVVPVEISKEKTQRNVINSMSLRDRPVLDEIQDSIMRDNPYQTIFLAGPAGTGKTTTLIKKLRQNLDKEYSKITGSDKSWYMFSPSDLLKSYLKESFAREGVGAPDENVKIWGDFSREFSVGLLLNNTKKTDLFVLTGTETLRDCHADNLIKIFDDFYEYHENSLKNKIIKGGKYCNDDEINKIVQQIFEKQITEKNASSFSEQLKERADYLNTIIEKQIIKLLRDLFFADIKKLETFYDWFNEYAKEKDKILYKYESNKIKPLVRPFIRLVRNIFNRKAMDSNSAEYIINEKLKIANVIPQHQLKELGMLCNNMEYAKWVQNAFLNKITASEITDVIVAGWKEYRQLRNHLFWCDVLSKRISQNELDILILTYLKDIKKYKLDNNALNKTYTNHVKRFYRTQIFVDEVTDFSPIQLSIMYQFLRSSSEIFFAAGDFNQGLTTEGITTEKQLRWAIPTIKIINIHNVYRQSVQLADLSQRLIGKTLKDISQPEYLNLEGTAPAIGRGLNSVKEIARWLSERIVEIGQLLNGKIPSVAILVDNETNVVPIAQELNSMLEMYNIAVDACEKGKILGSKNNIRVFSVNYIKGLEFEAVFFVNVDLLAKEKPDSFKRFLYVGTSRAATFLGFTFNGNVMPQELRAVCHDVDFVYNWLD